MPPLLRACWAAKALGLPPAATFIHEGTALETPLIIVVMRTLFALLCAGAPEASTGDEAETAVGRWHIEMESSTSCSISFDSKSTTDRKLCFW